MPSEAQRLTRAPGRRDRLAVAVVSLGSVLVAGGALAVSELTHPAGTTAAGCIRFAEAGVLGGGAWHLCGEAANRFCNSRSSQAPSLRRQCRRLQKPRADGS